MGPSQSKSESAPPPKQQQQTKQQPAPKKQQTQQQQPAVVKRRTVQNDKANSTDMAILELKLQREKLKKTTDKYYNLSEKLKQAAKDAMNVDPVKNKANAIMLIKRSTQYEQQIELRTKQLLNLETSINAIEDGVLQISIKNALDQGAKQLEVINKELSNAEEVMERVREAVANQREISDILAAPVDMEMTGVDDDELEVELQRLMNGGATVKNKTTTTAKVNSGNGATTSDASTTNQVQVPSHEPKAGVSEEVKVPDHKPQHQEQVAREEKENETEEDENDDGRVAA